MLQTQAAGRPCNPWPKDALRITFGVIWLIDAVLKWLPGFRASYMSVIMGEAQGQPGWLRPWFGFWIRVQHPDALFLAWLVAVVETLIALALITGFARKITYSAAIVFSLLIWATAEALGGPTCAGPAACAAANIFAGGCAAALALSDYTGAGRLSADPYLGPRTGWWWGGAEVGRPTRQLAGAARPEDTTARQPRAA